MFALHSWPCCLLQIIMSADAHREPGLCLSAELHAGEGALREEQVLEWLQQVALQDCCRHFTSLTT